MRSMASSHQDQHAAEHPPGGADDPQQREEDDQQDERGAQVVARHHQQAEHARVPGMSGTSMCRQSASWPSFSLRASRSAPHTARASLAISDGWTCCPPMLDPPRRAVLRDADAADEREAEPDHRDREQRVGEGTEQPGRRARRHPHQRQADGGAEELLLEVGVRREPRGQVDHRRGGLHHDQAEPEQQRGDAQHEVVGRERPVEQRAPHADPVPHAAQAGQPQRVLGSGRSSSARSSIMVQVC